MDEQSLDEQSVDEHVLDEQSVYVTSRQELLSCVCDIICDGSQLHVCGKAASLSTPQEVENAYRLHVINADEGGIGHSATVMGSVVALRWSSAFGKKHELRPTRKLLDVPEPEHLPQS